MGLSHQFRDPFCFRHRFRSRCLITSTLSYLFSHPPLVFVKLKLVYPSSTNLESFDVSRLISRHMYSPSLFGQYANRKLIEEIARSALRLCRRTVRYGSAVPARAFLDAG